jgi:hypothetical protein
VSSRQAIANRTKESVRLRSAFRSVLLAVGCIFVVVLMAGPALAQSASSTPSNDQIVLDGRLIVPESESVGTAVIFNGPAVVAGTVTDSLVVFNGRVVITGTVQGDVFVFHGQVTVASSGVVRGNLASQSTPSVASGATVGQQQRLNAVDWESVGLVSRLAWWLGYSISVLILGMLLLAFAPRLDNAILDAWRQRTGASIGLGIATFILVPIVAILFLVIVIAVPLGLFLLLAIALLYTLGYTAATHLIGRLVMKPPRSRFAAFAIGWLILRGLALIPFVGGLVWVLAAALGLGLLFVAARRAAITETSAATVSPVSGV